MRTHLRFLKHSLFAAGLVLIVGTLFVGGITAHDQEGQKALGNSAGAGIGGDGPWEYSNITLLGRLSLSEIGGGASNVLGNDIWGWTDPLNGKEYAIYGLSNGTSFIDITDPYDPKYLGKLPTHTGNKTWRDMKVYNNHVFIVADNNGSHGMQIFDLTELRNVDPENPQFFSSTAHYSGFGEAHNIVINEDSGYAYVVGGDVSSGGLHVLDISDPVNPTYAGQFTADGYTHDAQVVYYHGPDEDHYGKEIAFNSNEDTLTIVDVSNKSNMTMISKTGYSGSEYSHQGWLSEDHRFFYMDDELDEWFASTTIPTRTRVWDVQDLDNPVYIGYYNGVETTIDHNLYVKGNYIYQGNYTSGLRVLKVNDAATLDIEEYGFFDTYNTDNNISFNGAWSCYPYFESGSIIINDRQNGLFIVRTDMVEISPSGSTVITGKQTEGQLVDLAVSDDFKSLYLPQGGRRLEIELECQCPFASASTMSFALESQIERIQTVTRVLVDMYDFDQQTWERVASELIGNAVDSKLDIELDGDVNRFIDAATGQVKARLDFRARAKYGNFGSAPRSRLYIDHVAWTFEE